MKNAVRKNLQSIFRAAINSVMPEHAVFLQRDFVTETYRRKNYRKLYVIGFGKAACQMAKGLESALPARADKVILITKYGHCQSINFEYDNVDIYEAGHPVPDRAGLNATGIVLELLTRTDKETMVICLISGGGSSLLVSPCDEITFEEKQITTEILQKAGADIRELNTVRKCISGIKGGKLAAMAYPARIVSLIISDVVGDMLDVIASGPTSPDSSTYSDALSVISRVDVIKKIPVRVVETLLKGKAGLLPETPKSGNPIFNNVSNIIVGNNAIAIKAAMEKAESLGYETHIVSSPVTGEARIAGRELAKKAMNIHHSLQNRNNGKICVISGGETTVTVKGKGTGGRNIELALSFAQEVHGIRGISLLSAGTDGSDNITDAAGAFADGATVIRALKKGLDSFLFLENNDSYSFFKELNDLFITGPTGTNVMDLQIMVIE